MLFRVVQSSINMIQNCVNFFLIVCITISFHSFYKTNSNASIGKLIDSNQKCSPLIQTNTTSQYKVLIDNILYPQSVPIFMNKSLDFSCLNKSRMHTILFWNKPNWWDSSGDLRSCPISNCDIIFDKTKLNQSDLVLFHLCDGYLINNLPKRTSLNERWVLALYESPQMMVKMSKNTWWNPYKLSRIFNFSSTYRIDSDFPVKFYS